MSDGENGKMLMKIAEGIQNGIQSVSDRQSQMIGKLDRLTSEQHEIKNNVEKIGDKVDSATEMGLENKKDIQFLRERFEENKTDNEEKHGRIYDNMDKKFDELIARISEKADETMRKNKLWIFSVGGTIAAPIIIFLILKSIKMS